MTNTLTGTKEWAPHSVNCIYGCAHNCRYCYAAELAHRFKRRERADWQYETVSARAVLKPRRKLDGIVMFPTTHDITPDNLFATGDVLERLVLAGNQVLIVTKPHYDIIRELCQTFENHKDQIEFRFTITALDDTLLKYWEPNAPSYRERWDALNRAHFAGYRTSVSIEPMLDTFDIDTIILALEPFVTETIWLGKLNNIGHRVRIETDHDRQMVDAIKAGQTDERIRAIYDRWKDEPNIRWKDSIKKVMGLPLDEEPPRQWK